MREYRWIFLNVFIIGMRHHHYLLINISVRNWSIWKLSSKWLLSWIMQLSIYEFFSQSHTFDKIFNISILQIINFGVKKTRFKVTANKFKSKCLDDQRRRHDSRRWGWNFTHTNINTHLQGNAREMCIPYTLKRLSQQNLVQPMRNWERASTKDLRNSLLLAIGSLAHVRIQ